MNDSIVRCTVCNRTKEVNFSTCLRQGWPTCCDLTMRLESSPSRETIDHSVADAMRPVSILVEAFIKAPKR